jgi:prepilin-type N-terminal cleavage/methylation domain-containing protein
MSEKSGGFTLIELLVVIAIIGLLSSIVLASLGTAKQKANDAQRLSAMNAVSQALELYANDHGGLYPADPATDTASACGGSTPTCVDDLTVLTAGKYIGTLPSDPNPAWAGTASNYRYCAQAGLRGYNIIIRTETLHPLTWCRPEIAATSTACSWDSRYSSC